MLILLLTSAVLCAAILRFVGMVEAAKIMPVTTPAALRTAKLAAPTPATPAVAAVASSTPSCTPFGIAPAPTALPMTTPGLQQLVDTPATYTIYGSSTSEVASQLRRCAPSSNDGTFSGATSYWLGTHYSYELTPIATCKLTDISVAVHVSQVLPALQNSSHSAVSAKWDAYERSLVLHENGHTVIDISHAQTLLDELTAMPDMPCDTIASAASSITTNRVAALDQANDAYDAATNHGATQGASW